MLHILLGRSGSGKTQYILDTLRRLADGDKPVILLVPEQHSFENERAMLETLTPEQTHRVKALSFTRLAQRVFLEIGIPSGGMLDEGSRALMMSRALEMAAAAAEDRGETLLGIAPRQVTDVAFVGEMLTLLDEIKQCAVPLQTLEQVGNALTDATAAQDALKHKTTGLYHVFSVYEGLVADSGMDSADLLTRLYEHLGESTLLKNAVLLVDGFKGFTAQELRVLEGLLTQGADITVALSTDTPGAAHQSRCPADNHREYALFSPVTRTVNALQEIADKHRVEVTYTLLDQNRRATNESLRALEAGLYHPAPVVCEDATDRVTLTPCADIYEECAYVARRIRRLLREGYRCGDITLVTRQPDAYQGILEDALEEADIPYYIDARQDIQCEPLVVYIRTALRMAVGGVRAEEVLRLLKTDLGPLSPTQTAQLENYLYLWGLDGDALRSPFTENPLGMDAKSTPQSRALLNTLEGWRQQVVGPLEALRQDLKGRCTGRQFAMAVYRFLTRGEGLPLRIAQRVRALEDMGEPLQAQREARLWDEVIGILDRFASVLAQQSLTAARLEDLFGLLVGTIDMGHIPQGLDTVTVGCADRIRYTNPRVVFVLGANEGQFPAYPETAGILTEEDRRLWEAHGIRLYGDLLHRCVEERYYAYMAVAAPSERLFITYLTDGEEAPSPLVEAVRRILPGHQREEAVASDGRDLETGEEIFRRLAANYSRSTPVTEALRILAAEDPVYSGPLQALSRVAQQTPFHLQDTTISRGLFGQDMCLSASQTELFHKCAFAYFCRYGLHIKPRPVAQVDAAAFGSIVHHVMETLLPTYTATGGLVDELRAEDNRRKDWDNAKVQTAEQDTQNQLTARIQQDVHTCVTAYADTLHSDRHAPTGSFLYRLLLAQRAAGNMLWHVVMELRQSAFNPVDFELNIHPAQREEEGILSLRLPIDGGSVQLSGKVDRVDLYVRPDGTAFVRVVDYKTGNKEFKLGEVFSGIGTQMLLYLFILCDNSHRYTKDGAPLRPAGVLYHPLSDLLVERGADDALTARLKTMQMDGVVLDDPATILAMDKQGNKTFIPAGLKKDGSTTGPVLRPEHFDRLRKVIEQLLIHMGNDLLAGNIAALPLCNDTFNACEYCDYRAVCGRDKEDPSRHFRVPGTAAAIQRLEEENPEEVTGRE